jgi:hypothetical protein
MLQQQSLIKERDRGSAMNVSCVSIVHARRAAEKQQRKAERAELEASLDGIRVDTEEDLLNWCLRNANELLSTPDVEAILVGIGARTITIHCWPQMFKAISVGMAGSYTSLSKHARKLLVKRLLNAWLIEPEYIEVLRGRVFGDRVIFDENWVARGHTLISFSTDKLDTTTTNWLYARVPDDRLN